MFSTTSEQGLTVVHAEADAQTVDRALKRLDRSLFLDIEWSPTFGQFYAVKYRAHSGRGGVIPVLDWTEDGTCYGRPLPCSMAIVDRVAAQEKRSKADIVNGATSAQAARNVRDRDADRAAQEREDIFREHEHRLSPGHGTPVTITTPLRGPS